MTHPRMGRSTWREKAAVLLICTAVAIVGLEITGRLETAQQETPND